MAASALHHLMHLLRAQRWGPGRTLASQLRLLDRVYRVARAHVPMYRDLYAAAGVRVDHIATLDDFHVLPLVTKEHIKASFPDRIVSDRASPRKLYPIATSGTTDRVMLFHDLHKRNWDRAADWLIQLQGNRFRPGHRQMLIPSDACYERCGADEHGRAATLASRLGDLARAGRGRRLAAARQLASQVMRDCVWREKLLPALGVEGTAATPDRLEGYLRAIRQWQPRCLSGLPTFLHILAAYVDRDVAGPGSAPRVPIIRPSGGKLTEEMTRRLERAFGARVRENYGTAELGTVACDCEHSRGQHLLGELFHVEFLRAGRHVAPGELGEIVVTDLRNLAAPLIRYRVGDVGRYDPRPCECGFTGLRFSVNSRLTEVVVTPDGEALAGDQLLDFFLGQPGVEHARLVQEGSDRFTAEIVPSSSGDGLPAPDVLSRAFGTLLGHPVTLRSRRVKALLPDRSGKYTHVASTSFHEFHAGQEAMATAGHHVA